MSSISPCSSITKKWRKLQNSGEFLEMDNKNTAVSKERKGGGQVEFTENLSRLKERIFVQTFKSMHNVSIHKIRVNSKYLLNYDPILKIPLLAGQKLS